MVYTLRFSPSSNCSLFNNSNVFGSCVIHILYTECAKIKKNNSGAKRLVPSVLATCVKFQEGFTFILKTCGVCSFDAMTTVDHAFRLVCRRGVNMAT